MPETTREAREAAVRWVYGRDPAKLTEETQRWIETSDGYPSSIVVDLARLLTSHAAAAVAAERERCAKALRDELAQAERVGNIAAQPFLKWALKGVESEPFASLPRPPRGVEPAGLYMKYRVERTDGSSGPGGKHERCDYFVLDWMHDPHAIPAALAYATACEATYPQLAADLRARARVASGKLGLGDPIDNDPSCPNCGWGAWFETSPPRCMRCGHVDSRPPREGGETCKRCDGKGTRWDGRPGPCTRCKGRGVVGDNMTQIDTARAAEGGGEGG